MAKVINKVINHCGECPFCDYEPSYSIGYDSGFDCKNDDSTKTRILNDFEKKIISQIPIPEWCGLPNKQ